MNGLRDLQEVFQAYVLSGDAAAIEARVTGSRRATALTRLGVYGEAYALRLLEALESDYPVLRAVVGEGGFEALGRRYIVGHPSHHFSIRWFGGDLARLLRDAGLGERPWLAELAAFEWAMTEVFDAADAPTLVVEEMAAVPPEQWPGMRLIVHPSLRRLDLRWDVTRVWKAVKADEPPPVPVRTTKPVAWVLWRRDLTNYFRSLPEDAAWALDAVRDGATFSDLCQGVCEWVAEADAPLQAAGLLKGWVTDGLISRVEPGS
ncbi:MAG TPA: DNA-binding domain-containing protein [Gammaproteobacteria bacterium]|nr:DNA-binding domain-containing protein [Gammaproteobacteria bacterium]